MNGITRMFENEQIIEYNEATKVLTIYISDTDSLVLNDYIYGENCLPLVIDCYDDEKFLTFFASSCSATKSINVFQSNGPKMTIIYNIYLYLESIPSWHQTNDFSITIQDTFIDYLFKPDRVFMREEAFVNVNNKNEVRSVYTELVEEECKKTFCVDGENKIYCEFGVHDTGYSFKHRTIFDRYSSYLKLIFKNKALSANEIRDIVTKTLMTVSFLFRVEIRKFNNVTFEGLLESNYDNITRSGKYIALEERIELNMANYISFDRVEKYLGKTLNFFYNTELLPSYYDVNPQSFSELKMFKLISNFDSIANNIPNQHIDENLVEQKKIGGIVKRLIKECQEITKEYKPENITRIIQEVTDIKRTLKEKIVYILEMYPEEKEQILENYITIEDYAKKIVKYRNNLMHGGNDFDITHEDIKMLEKILYLAVFSIIGFNELEVYDYLESVAFGSLLII